MATWSPNGSGSQPELLVVGGTFTVAGNVLANGVASWDGSAWQSFGTGMNGWVEALTVFDGDLIAGGTFTTADGVSANHIARWNGTSWQPLGTGTNDNVYALAVYNGELIAAGSFTNAGGVAANRVARWNGSVWQPLGAGTNNTVYALAVFNGQLVAGGTFSSAGGVSALRIARWNGTSWQPLGTGMACPTCTPVVYALTVYNSQLIAGGGFTSAGGTAANYIARWNGTGWSALGSGVTAGSGGYPTAVQSLTVYNGELIAGGNFTVAGSVTANHLARWNGTAWQSVWTGMAQEFDYVLALAVYNDELIAGGAFLDANLNYIGRWNGASWQSLGAGMGVYNEVNVLTVQNGELIVGGGFATIGDISANSIASWNGTTWHAFGSGITEIGCPACGSTVWAVAEYNGDLIVAGQFDTAGGVSASAVARWDGVSWQPMGSGIGVYQAALALAVYDGNLYLGGQFTIAGGVTANSIARWNGTDWEPVGEGMYDQGSTTNVHALTVYNGELIAGGCFGNAGGVIANCIARWNGTAWQALGTGTNHNWACVGALTVFNGELIAGGSFTTAGGVSASKIARWNGTDWQPLGEGVSGDFARVRALTVYNGELVAGGYFAVAGQVSANQIARWDGTTWQPLGTGTASGGDPLVSSLTAYNGELIAGGTFTAAGNQASAHLARWGPACPLGDMNCDQLVNEVDLPLFASALLSDTPLSTCDAYTANVNGDVFADGMPRVDGADIQPFVNLLIGPQ